MQNSRQALIVRQLKEELEEYRMDESFLRGDDEKVKYYIGLPNFAIFQAMLLNLLPYIHQGNRKLTAFQCVLLTLMRLRLDLPFFNTSVTCFKFTEQQSVLLFNRLL